MNIRDILEAKRRDATGGFTLVELLVVIAIIGVLATLVLLQLGTARARARDTKRIADINQIRSAVEQYYEDNGGKYPADIVGTSCPTTGTLCKYLVHVPQDPLTSSNYGYGVTADFQKYQVYTTLEQSASALNGSAHINGKNFDGTAGVDASAVTQAGCTAAPNTAACLYDQGVQ